MRTLHLIRVALIALIALVVLASSAAAGEGMFDKLRRIDTLPLPDRQAAVDDFMNRIDDYPVCKLGCDSLAILYRGPGRDVRIAGDATDWQPTLPLEHLPGTDLWYHLFANGPADARLDYKFVIDGDWRLDALNPLTCRGGFGPNSELRLDGYRPPPFTRETGLAPCRIDTLAMEAPGLGGLRTVVVLAPPGGAAAAGSYLLVHDGLEYITLGGLDQAVSWCAAHRPDIRLPLCVCVPPGRRTEEYATDLQAEFGRFIIDTLMPQIEARYGDRGPWGTMGASYGGNISLYLARRYPDRFDQVAAMSPAVAPEQHDGIAALDPASLTLYVNWGTYDIPSLIPDCKRFTNMLQEKGFRHEVEVKSQGHSWGFWRDSLIPALTFLYGTK